MASQAPWSNRAPTPFQQLMAKRGAVAEIVLIAVVLAVAVNLGAGAIQALLPPGGWWPLLISCAIGAVTLICVLRWVFAAMTREVLVQGTLVRDRKSNRLVPVFRYPFAEGVANSIEAACSEDHALRQQWHSSGLIAEGDSTSPAGRLAREGIEAFVLRLLAGCLSDSISQGQMAKSEAVTLRRSELGPVLLSNRVLDVATKPLSDRACFRDCFPLPLQGTVVRLEHPNGAVFSRLELILPAKSSVSRPTSDVVRVETTMFALDLRCCAPAHLKNLPHWFSSFYIKSDPEQIVAYSARVEVSVRFKWRALLAVRQQRRFKWLDDFLEDVNEACSCDLFFDRIGWEAAVTMLRCAKLGSKVGNPWDTLPQRTTFAAVVEVLTPEGDMGYQIMERQSIAPLGE